MAQIYDPNMDFTIVDNSIPTQDPETPSLDTSLSILAAGFTSRGRKNKIIEFRTRGAIMNEYGDDFDNFDKFGQANLTAMGILRGKGRAFFCSLCPENAKTANAIFGVSVKKIDNIPVYQRNDTVLSDDKTSIVTLGKASYVLDELGNNIQVKLKADAADEEATVLATVSGVELTLQTKNLAPTDFKVDGVGVSYEAEVSTTVIGEGEGRVETKFYPLLTVSYFSKGNGGNYIAFRIARDATRDKKMTDGRRYTLGFYELTSVGSWKAIMNDSEPYYFSFNKDARFAADSTDSDYLGDMYINMDMQGELQPVQMLIHNDIYQQLISDLSEFKDPSELDTDIDFINALFKNGTPYNRMVMGAASIDAANTYIRLTGGSEGDLDSTDPAVVEATKKQLLSDFFNCDVDDMIFDEKITDIDILPDCNYPDAIKKIIMSSFSVYRPDIALRMDLGLEDVATPQAAIARFRELSAYVNNDYSFMCSINGHAGILTDVDVGMPYRVTYTYDYIRGMADAFNTANGAFQMRAGSQRGKVKYFLPDWIAKKNKSNVIETLDELGLNYIMYLNKQKEMVYMSESSQYEINTSKLLSDRNALVIGRTMRICAGTLVYYKFREEGIGALLEDARQACLDNIAKANIPSTIKVEIAMAQTKQDKKEENAHCYIDFTFPDYAKKFHVEIRAHRNEA